MKLIKLHPTILVELFLQVLYNMGNIIYISDLIIGSILFNTYLWLYFSMWFSLQSSFINLYLFSQKLTISRNAIILFMNNPCCHKRLDFLTSWTGTNSPFKGHDPVKVAGEAFKLGSYHREIHCVVNIHRHNIIYIQTLGTIYGVTYNGY